jgi:hypothetical protein
MNPPMSLHGTIENVKRREEKAKRKKHFIERKAQLLKSFVLSDDGMHFKGFADNTGTA